MCEQEKKQQKIYDLLDAKTKPKNSEIIGVSLCLPSSPDLNPHDYAISYLPTPPLGQDMTQGQFFKRSLTGLNSEFSFS